MQYKLYRAVCLLCSASPQEITAHKGVGMLFGAPAMALCEFYPQQKQQHLQRARSTPQTLRSSVSWGSGLLWQSLFKQMLAHHREIKTPLDGATL